MKNQTAQVVQAVQLIQPVQPLTQNSSELPCIPLGDRVLVELVMETRTPGGIDLPERTVKHGIVRAIGRDVKETLFYHSTHNTEILSRGMKVGDKVYLPKGSNIGDKFIIGEDATRKVYLLLPAVHIAAIIP